MSDREKYMSALAERAERAERVFAVIDAQLERGDLNADDVLTLTIARRLNGVSEATFAQALGSIEQKPPLNFWNKR